MSEVKQVAVNGNGTGDDIKDVKMVQSKNDQILQAVEKYDASQSREQENSTPLQPMDMQQIQEDTSDNGPNYGHSWLESQEGRAEARHFWLTVDTWAKKFEDGEDVCVYEMLKDMWLIDELHVLSCYGMALNVDLWQYVYERIDILKRKSRKIWFIIQYLKKSLFKQQFERRRHLRFMGLED